jgi:TPR repeat protein
MKPDKMPDWKQIAAMALFVAAFTTCIGQAAEPDPTLLAKASAGDAAAQVQLGESYAQAALAEQNSTLPDREQIASDYKQEEAWYRKAANQGNISAELRLAIFYRDGGGPYFSRDMEQAAAWYRKAADQGDVSAQGTLGLLYSIGQGVPRSAMEAYFWLALAAEVKGPNQQQFDANRQNVGTRISTDELEDIQYRVKKWNAAHPRPDTSK